MIININNYYMQEVNPVYLLHQGTIVPLPVGSLSQNELAMMFALSVSTTNLRPRLELFSNYSLIVIGKTPQNTHNLGMLEK